MSGCQTLIKAIDAYIAKVDSNLTDELDEAGFAEPKSTVDDISRLEEKVADTLKAETRYIHSKIQEAVDLESFAANWHEIKNSDNTDEALSKIFLDEFQEQIPKLADAYIKVIDPELTVSAITRRTIAWIEDWSEKLGGLMKLTAHNEVERLLAKNLAAGNSVAQLAQDFIDSKIRGTKKGDYYKARRAALTEMLRAHSVAQQEAIVQNPACSKKQWVHTGSYRNEPRPNHVDMNNQIVLKDEPFELNSADGKTIHHPMYPRDSELPPEESVNCHCIHRGIADEDVLGLSLEERQRLQQQAIDEDDGEWERELDARNRAKAGIDVNSDKNGLTNTGNSGIMSVGGENNMNELEARKKILNGVYSSNVVAGRQRKHIESTFEFEQNSEKLQRINPGSRPSILTADAQELVDKYKGTGVIRVLKNSPYPQETIDTHNIIGKTWVISLQKYVDTQRIRIVYSSKGVHVIPVNDSKRS